MNRLRVIGVIGLESWGGGAGGGRWGFCYKRYKTVRRASLSSDMNYSQPCSASRMQELLAGHPGDLFGGGSWRGLLMQTFSDLWSALESPFPSPDLPRDLYICTRSGASSTQEKPVVVLKKCCLASQDKVQIANGRCLSMLSRISIFQSF